MIKPTHQWETRSHRAVRTEERPFADDPRSEAFVLHCVNGREGWAHVGLERQQVDARSRHDASLIHAICAWLVARGKRHIALRDENDRIVAESPINLTGLSNLPQGPCKRIITICPSNVEMVWALGCFDRVIACEDSSDFPPEVESLERLGPDLGPNLDRIAELEPDLVISSLTVPGMERNVTGLRARGVPQLVLAPRSLDDVLAELQTLGRILEVPYRAAAVIDDMRKQIATLEREALSLGEPARVYLEWWPRPMFSPGSDCYSNELIMLAGGVNVFGERPGSSLQIEAEELLAANPEVCFVSWCGVAADKLDIQRLIGRPGLEQLSAARKGAVYPLDEQFSGRPGPRMLEAARIMAAGIRAARQLD